jgi:hypothetical protein
MSHPLTLIRKCGVLWLLFFYVLRALVSAVVVVALVVGAA